MTTLSDLFEQLRHLAETDTADAGTDKRRPSWGPALILGDEILTALADLNHPLPAKPVARLWATFAGRDRLSTVLRRDVSTLPMPEARVRAFELRLGADRSGARLLQAKRDRDGLWSVGPTWLPYPRWRELRTAEKTYESARDRVNQLTRWINSPMFATIETHPDQWRGEHARNELKQNEAAVASSELALAEEKSARAEHQQRLERLNGLVKQRVAEFAGDPFAQMVAGAHVTGNCAMCGRGLSDSRSMERGIGPECFGRISPQLRAYVWREELAA